MYMIAIVTYLTNIVKGLRIVSTGTYGIGIDNLSQEKLDDVDLGTGVDQETGGSVLGREDNLKVLSASNTILALVLVGVLVLQIGQWYAERAEEKERAQIAKRAETESKSADGAVAKRVDSKGKGKKKD